MRFFLEEGFYWIRFRGDDARWEEFSRKWPNQHKEVSEEDGVRYLVAQKAFEQIAQEVFGE
jgi:hypothetical protein